MMYVGSVVETYEYWLAEGENDYWRWKAYLTPMVGKVTRMWVSAAAYESLVRALWAYRALRGQSCPHIYDNSGISIYGITILPREGRR